MALSAWLIRGLAIETRDLHDEELLESLAQFTGPGLEILRIQVRMGDETCLIPL